MESTLTSASRAALAAAPEKPHLPRWLLELGHKEPRPLRTEAMPEGDPALPIDPRGKEKVEAANRLYRFAIVFIYTCEELGVDWTLENPLRSLLW